MSDDGWVFFYMFDFTDGTKEGQVMCCGTEEECRMAEKDFGGVFYPGKKEIVCCNKIVARNQHDMKLWQMIEVRPDG